MEGSILVAVSLLYHLGRSQDSPWSRTADLGLTLLTTLGGNQDNTVGTTHTEYGCGRSILQNGDALDFLRIHIAHASLYTIHLNQRVGTIERCLTTNKYARCICTRLTGILYGGYTRKLTTEHIVDITYRGTDQVFTLHAGEGTCNGYLLLHTIGNYLYSLEGSSLFLQDHLHAVFGNHGLWYESNVTDL